MNSTVQWLTRAFGDVVGFIPNLIAALVILLVGYLVARLLAAITRPLLHKVGFDRLTGRLGLSEKPDSDAGSRWAGSVVFALVLIAAIMQAARALGLQFVADGLARFFAYVPHLIGAAFIFAVALYFGNWVRDRMVIRAETSKEEGRGIAASTVRAGILAVGAFMALRELQIAPEIVTIAFTVTVVSIGVAAALAFGLGGRSVAGKVAQQWYDHRTAGNGASRVTEFPAQKEGVRPPP
jgi:prepilin signal peptidase PulO-like enzyme (type II secretory pathway)